MKRNQGRCSRTSARFVSFALPAALLLFALGTLAQSTTDGAIGGVVTDSSGGVVPGATVTARNLGTSGAATATTDGNGR